MRRIEFGSAFKKDHKRMVKRGASLSKLDSVLELLMADTPLPSRNRPSHAVWRMEGVLGVPY